MKECRHYRQITGIGELPCAQLNCRKAVVAPRLVAADDWGKQYEFKRCDAIGRWGGRDRDILRLMSWWWPAERTDQLDVTHEMIFKYGEVFER